MPTWPHQSSAEQFFGRNLKITKGVAGPDPVWERANLVLTPLPWKAVAAWDTALRIKSLRVHRLVADDLAVILNEIWEAFSKSQKAIEAAGMHLVGGGYNWRMMRGINRLSMHALGIALDFDPARNALGDPTPAMDARVVEIFEQHGWVWGGRWSVQRRDGMHFQAARV